MGSAGSEGDIEARGSQTYISVLSSGLASGKTGSVMNLPSRNSMM